MVRLGILVIFSFSKASSSITLSSSRRESRSTIKTFHCEEKIREVGTVRGRAEFHTSCFVM